MSDTAAPRGFRARIAGSFQASVGDIVFRMEDGAVSIFGLVFSVAAGSSDSHAVVLAGARAVAGVAIGRLVGGG